VFNERSTRIVAFARNLKKKKVNAHRASWRFVAEPLHECRGRWKNAELTNTKVVQVTKQEEEETGQSEEEHGRLGDRECRLGEQKGC
jgi:hypothetical protein